MLLTAMGEGRRTILVAGDLAPLGRPERLLVEGQIDKVFGDLLPLIGAADCFVANLEGPLTTSTRKLSKAGPKLKANPGVARALGKAGVSVVSLANNHIFDYGLAGLEDTKAALEQSSIRWFGVGKNVKTATTPLFVALGGFRLGLLSYAEHEFNWQGDDQWCTSMLEPAENVLQIQGVAGQCDALIVLLHAGPENWHYPSPRIVKVCRAFAKAGASAVLVAHAHAIMGSESHQGVPIVYGLGNFLFHSERRRPLAWRIGLIVRLQVKGRRSVQLQHIPVVADPDTGCIHLLGEEERNAFDGFYRGLCGPLNSMTQIEKYWSLFCASQAPHITREVLKALAAMCPGALLQKLLPRCRPPSERSYYRKGACLLRGLLVCENHQDVLGRIFDLLQRGCLAEHRLRAESLKPGFPK